MRCFEKNPNDGDGITLELFIGMLFSDYVGQMARDGTYGDQLTLKADSDIYTFSLQSFQLLELKQGQIFDQIALILLAE